ncbi:class I SAM-dependent methyltransferase [Streptomyces sp. URMC 129]|uniref:class I SAM-dependent methyltransferase n=1 Tax=Streptomyces sp. URMC 129 TaxID=3423407 RepID=UPI003F1A9654
MREAWEVYAEAQRNKPERERNAAGEVTWFNWTLHPDHGPGADVLGSPETVLELGCGSGRNIAHLARLGAKAVGLDVASSRIDRARERFGDIPGLDLVCDEATAYLGAGGQQFDAVFSVFGAVWFTDPAILMPLIRASLRPGGILAFSHHPPIEGCYGCQGSYVHPANGGRPVPLRRWAYTPDMWRGILTSHAFEAVTGRIIPAPDGDGLDTMLVTATRPRHQPPASTGAANRGEPQGP